MASWADKKPGASERKKWNLEDRTSLRNLKFHLAENGCSEVQYDLARQLLEGNSETDPIGSHTQGVHWLLCAAQQGHEGALELLDECYRDRRGITASNECEVRACLGMSTGERAARKAARELFACLSNGEEYITASQLEAKMREIYKMQKTKRRNHSGGGGGDGDENMERIERNGIRPTSPPIHRIPRGDVSYPEVLTEANIVSAAVNYSHGHLPPVSRELTLSTPDPQQLDHIPCFHRPIFHPIVFLNLLYHRFIKILSSVPGSGTFSSNLQLLLLLTLYTLFASDSFASFIPITGYYLSLVIMIVSTFKMLKTKHDFIDFRIWSGLFLSYGDERINVEHSEHQFIKNNQKPYLYFFLSFIVNIILYPFILDNHMILHSEITVISFLLIFLSMFAIMYRADTFPDYLSLVSFGVNVLAKYPYEMDEVVITGWRFLDLKVPTFSSFVIGNGIEFCLNCRSALYILIPGFLIILAHRENWRGTYRYLIPHCVTLSWLQICIVSSQSATMFGLVRATLGLAGLLLFLPLFGIVTLLIPIFAALEWLSLTNPTIRVAAIIIALLFAIVGSCVMAANHRTEKYITILQVLLCIMATVFLTFPYMTSNFSVSHSQASKVYENILSRSKNAGQDDMPVPHLTWNLYERYCHQQAWEHVNKVKTQLRCSQLDNTLVQWEGSVSDVEITRISNIPADFIKNYLPTTFGDFLFCFYGEKNKIDCNSSEDCDDIKTFLDDQKKCHLNRWNSYEYEITIRMQAQGILKKPAEILLKAGDQFGNFTLRLNQSDRVWFKGHLKNFKTPSNTQNGIRLGKNRPVVELTGIGCVACNEPNLEQIVLPDGMKINPRMRDLMRGVKYLLNVLFNPMLTFK